VDASARDTAAAEQAALCQSNRRTDISFRSLRAEVTSAHREARALVDVAEPPEMRP
jgi:hypothetical protein